MTKPKPTSDMILDHAGPIFAEKGFANATGKAICADARVNAAAINYHFGGMEGLYEAVLDRVTDRMLRFDGLESIAQRDSDARRRTEEFIAPLIDMLFADDDSRWMFKVAGHEIVAPLSTSQTFVSALEHLGTITMEFVHSITGLPKDHPSFPILSAMFLGGMQWLVVADRQQIAQMYPGLDFAESAKEDIKNILIEFTLGGLLQAAQALAPKT